MTENHRKEMLIEYSRYSPNDEDFLGDRFLRENQIGFADEPKDTVKICRNYPNAIPMKAKKGTEIIAFWICERISDEPVTYLIWDFVVHRSYQSQGYGRQILEDQIRELYEECEAKRIVLGIIPENGAAISLYSKLGFKNSGEMNEDGELIFRFDIDGPISRCW